MDRTAIAWAGLLGLCTAALVSCSQGSKTENEVQASASLAVLDTQWTDAAAKRTEKLVNDALQKGPSGASQYALPELRIYDQRQQLIFHGKGVEPGKMGALLDQVASAKRPIAGPTFQETLVDLETSDHQPANEYVRPGDHITIFDYWAEWCVPCKALEKELLAWAGDQPPGTVQIIRAEADLMKLARARGDKIIMMKRDANGKLIKEEIN